MRTLAQVTGGVKYGEGKPVYVLTSGSTFSAAEGFTYHLRSFERATVVGEQTRGGAHPVRLMKINERFRISVPFARAVNPLTGTNWEGVGVKPHIRTSRGEALRAAHIHALDTLIEQNSDHPQKVEDWKAARKALQEGSQTASGRSLGGPRTTEIHLNNKACVQSQRHDFTINHRRRVKRCCQRPPR